MKFARIGMIGSLFVHLSAGAQSASAPSASAPSASAPSASAPSASAPSAPAPSATAQDSATGAAQAEPAAPTESGYRWVVNDMLSPLRREARPFLEIGSVATLGLYLLKPTVVDPVQRDVHNNKPLGGSSKYGDLSGQWIPNALYAGGMYAASLISGSSQSRYRALYMLRTTLYASIIAVTIKTLVQEERPNGSRLHNSFPSGHSTTAFAFAGAVMTQHPWYFGLPAFALASFVGFSRMNDNFHYLHDVAGGATLGLSYAFGLYHLDRARDYPKHSFQLLPMPVHDGSGLVARFEF